MRGVRRGGRLAFAVAAVAMALISTTGVEAAGRINAQEQDALAARMLQTELMVAALRCNEHGRYNAFVHRFEDQLVTRGRTLKGMFVRLYGSQGVSRLNSFITRIANEASLRSLAVGRDYCFQADALFANVLAAQPTQFSALAQDQPFSEDHGLDVLAPAALKADLDAGSDLR